MDGKKKTMQVCKHVQYQFIKMYFDPNYNLPNVVVYTF